MRRKGWWRAAFWAGAPPCHGLSGRVDPATVCRAAARRDDPAVQTARIDPPSADCSVRSGARFMVALEPSGRARPLARAPSSLTDPAKILGRGVWRRPPGTVHNSPDRGRLPRSARVRIVADGGSRGRISRGLHGSTNAWMAALSARTDGSRCVDPQEVFSGCCALRREPAPEGHPRNAGKCVPFVGGLSHSAAGACLCRQPRMRRLTRRADVSGAVSAVIER